MTIAVVQENREGGGEEAGMIVLEVDDGTVNQISSRCKLMHEWTRCAALAMHGEEPKLLKGTETER